MISKEFDPTPDLYCRASREIAGFDRSLRLQSQLWLAFAVFLGLAGGLALLTPHQTVAGLVLLTAAAFWLLFHLALVPFVRRNATARRLQKSPTGLVRQKYDISPSRVRNYGEGFSIDLAWGVLTRVRVSRRFMLFFTSPRIAYFIPKELFTPSEIQQVLAWASANPEIEQTASR